jgi:nucleoside-diphosphate-sugar epimerase
LRILLTGSSGRIGAAIGARLSLRHRVTGLDRRAGPLTTTVVDIRDTTRIAALCRGIDAVVHTASLHVPDLASHGAAEFHGINVDATRRLLNASGEAGVRRFVYTSTTSLYGDSMLPADGAAVWVTESLPPRPRDVYDETKLAAEEACRAAANAGLACTSLRMSRCFPEDPRLLAIYRLYRGVDALDVAQAHELALAAEQPAFEIFNVSARPPFQQADCRALFTDAESLLAARFPWVRAEFARRGWLLPRSIDRVYVVDKAIERLGYRPVHDFASLFSRQAAGPAQGS